MIVQIRQLKLLLPTGVCPAPLMDIVALRQRCLTYRIATVSNLACSSLPAACFLGLFLCASWTVNGHATFAALPASVWAPHTSPCLFVGCRWLSHKLCPHSICRHADHPDCLEMAASLALTWACAPSSFCAVTKDQGSGSVHLQGYIRAMVLDLGSWV